MPRRLALIALVPLIAALAACAAPSGGTFDVAAAKQYCADQGGTVQTRQPTFGTNNDESQWVELGEPVEVCRFQTLGDGDESRIYADLATIWSTQPTLAALAYLAKTPLEGDTTANPASVLCMQLGGAVEYGKGAGGGGLVNTDDPIDTVFAPCVFADGSFIDEWGIAYYSADEVRGKDLADVFRFDPSQLPDVTF